MTTSSIFRAIHFAKYATWLGQRDNVLDRISALLADGEMRVVSLGVDEDFNTLCRIDLPPQLRVLSLSSHCDASSSLDEPAETKLAMLAGCLRSLTYSHISKSGYAHLAAFTQLVHLNISLTDGIFESFITALPSLTQLRAVELDGHRDLFGAGVVPIGAKDWNAMLGTLSTSLPALEHLSMGAVCHLDTEQLETALLRLERLVSLDLHTKDHLLLSPAIVDWRWLEALAEKGLLESLIVSGTTEHASVPSGVMCRVIEKCNVSFHNSLSTKYLSSYSY